MCYLVNLHTELASQKVAMQQVYELSNSRLYSESKKEKVLALDQESYTNIFFLFENGNFSLQQTRSITLAIAREIY